MGTIHRTGCVLCGQNCGLEVEVDNNRIVKVRPDKGNVRSEGYMCRKGMNIAYHEHHADRLKHPLKRVGDRFERISWEQAISEIAEKIGHIVSTHGPKAYAYMGGGGQGCHFEAAFGVRLMRSLGSQYHYSALAQELTGQFWVQGRAYGRQYIGAGPDTHETDMLVALGWNGMQSHQVCQAPRHLTRIAKDPDKILLVIDPRSSETAKIADIHLSVRVGTDALLLKAMIAIILQEGWENKDYIAAHVNGFDQIRPWFADVDARAACLTCDLDYDKVKEVCRLLTTRKWSIHSDLGILMNRHSTVTSYLEVILLSICGRIGVPGGNAFHGSMMPLGSHSDERDSRNLRTVTTGFPAITGVYPPNVLPEEILSDQPERVRAVLCCGSNPLRSFADTTAYEQAFSRLDLLVTMELAMTETAVLSHYVLPSRSGYESWDGTFFPMTYPGIYFQMRRPIIAPEGEPLEMSEIIVRLADKLGLIPPIPESLYEAAGESHAAFKTALFEYAQQEPAALKVMPFILGKTLGQAMGSANLAALWGMMQTAPQSFQVNAARVGFHPGPDLGEEVFQAIVDHPEGLWVGRLDPDKNLEIPMTEDKKVQVFIPELEDWLKGIDATSEEKSLARNPDYPLILMAGRHYVMNANTLMRDPSWNAGRRAGTMTMHPADAETLKLKDGQTVRVTTEAGSVEVELEVTDTAKKGHVVIPHGFGLVYQGKAFGANVNRLTKNTHRDKLAATPLHRYVPCRVEAAG
jgi:anaerobic selenocysteine-containing dehydrogenase